LDELDRPIRADGNALAQWISLTNGVTDMVVVLDTTASGPRHPEKAHRQDTAALRKPDWIRVKAPGSSAYAETRRIVRDAGLHTVCVEPAARTSANAGRRGTPP
jgi:hypothetical protein